MRNNWRCAFRHLTLDEVDDIRRKRCVNVFFELRERDIQALLDGKVLSNFDGGQHTMICLKKSPNDRPTYFMDEDV